MIVSMERSPERLCVEGKMRHDPARLVRFMVVELGVLTLLVVFWIALDRMLRSRGVPSETIPPGAIVGAAFVIVLLTSGVLFWLSSGRERLEIVGKAVVYERYVGLFKTYSAQYDLLVMKGLRCDLLMPSPTFGFTDSPPERPGPNTIHEWAVYPVGRSLAVWYKDEPFKFGDTFDRSEPESVAQALLEYESALRARLGLDPQSGLTDLSVWTPTRTLTLNQAWMSPLFTGGFLGHRSDFDK